MQRAQCRPAPEGEGRRTRRTRRAMSQIPTAERDAMGREGGAAKSRPSRRPIPHPARSRACVGVRECVWPAGAAVRVGEYTRSAV